MWKIRVGPEKRPWLTGLLGAYILLQFSWWAWLLIRQNQTIQSLERAEATSRASGMILGEGAVFLALLTWGFLVIWRGLQREHARAEKERHFLLAVTHELKTPIAGTQLAIDSLKKHEWDAATKAELLQDATAGLHRLEQRVENILQNNRLISGKEMTLASFDAETAIKDVIARHRIGPFQNRIIEVRQPDEALGLVRGDEDALVLAWGNLVENALKYSPSDEPLYIRLQQSDEVLVCTFDDGGTGIPENQRETVLKKFERIPNSDTSGTGLGLYLAHQIIRMHGGTLTLKDSQRGGCLITTQIPLNT